MLCPGQLGWKNLKIYLLFCSRGLSCLFQSFIISGEVFSPDETDEQIEENNDLEKSTQTPFLTVNGEVV